MMAPAGDAITEIMVNDRSCSPTCSHQDSWRSKPGSGERGAGALDAAAGLFQFFLAGGVGNAEVR